VSILNPITDALHSLLTFLYGFTRDYALAVVLLTLVIKAILHPLTRVQLRSMRAMQVLAPHMEALKRKYKDDPKMLNQEMMALYRAHNVNPMMGCLPMIIQLPVLWALYRLLYEKGLFGNATMFGVPWLRLDAIPKNLYAQVPTHPELLAIFAIPVLVAVTTWWQQRMSVTDPQQAKMFLFMPIMVGYFATLYPLGLSIYWIVSTFAYIGEYFLVVGRPHPMATAPPKSQQTQPAGDVSKPQAADGAEAKPGGAKSRQRAGGRQASLPPGKRGARRA
jgi:YidC/Oxa1 family membrane protein insertase